MRPSRSSSMPCAASHAGGSGWKPNAMMTTSAASTDSLPGTIDGTAAAARVGFAEHGVGHAHAFDAFAAEQRQRLAVEQELHAFLARIGDLARGAGHVGFVAPVDAAHAGRAQAHRAAHAIHAGVAAAEHDHALAAQVRQRDVVFPAGDRRAVRMQSTDDAAVLHQERQRRQHVGQILAGQAAIGVAVAAQAEEHRIELIEQRFQRDIAADLDAEAERHAHAVEHLAPRAASPSCRA